MSYKSLESIIRSVVLEEVIEEAALGDHRGLTALAKRKIGDEKNVIMRAADMMKKGQVKDLNMFMKAMDQSTHKAIMPFVDKKHHKALHEDIEELDEANPTGLKIYHKEKSGKEGHAIVFTAQDAQRRHNELKKAGHKVTHHALMYGTKEGDKKAVKEEIDLSFLDEKKLTSAELKKREEIAKAMERDNPDMPMDKKMAIATAQAKKVAEATVDTADIEKKKHISDSDKDKLSKIADMMRKERDVDEACWDGYKQEGMKKKGDKNVPNCVPEASEPTADKSARARLDHSLRAQGHRVQKPKKGKGSYDRKAMRSTRMEEVEHLNEASYTMHGEFPHKDGGWVRLLKRSNMDPQEKNKKIWRVDHHNERVVGMDRNRIVKTSNKSKTHVHGSYEGHAKRVYNELKKKHAMSHSDAKKHYPQYDHSQWHKGPVKESREDQGKPEVHTKKSDFKLTKVTLPDGRMAWRKVKKEVDVEK